MCKLWVFSKHMGVRRDSSDMIMTRRNVSHNNYDKAKENDLVSSLCIVKLCIRGSYFMLCFCDINCDFGCANKLEP